MAFEPMEATHEAPDVWARRVVLLVLGFVAFTLVLVAVLGTYYRVEIPSRGILARFQDFPGPRLQPNPTEDYVLFRRAQQAQLEGTRWVDKSKDLIHVPIERAMAYIAGRGDHAFDPLGPTLDQKPPPTPQDGKSRFVPPPDVARYGQGKLP